MRKERESEQNRDGTGESEEFESEMGESGREACSATRAANLTGLPAGRRQGERAGCGGCREMSSIKREEDRERAD